VLPVAAWRALRQADRRIRRAGRTVPGQPRDEALHRARKSARRARYAAEAMTPAVGRKAARFATRMKRVQSVLGEQHDAVGAAVAARDLGMSAHLVGENAFSYGLLCARSVKESERLQAQARRMWDKAARKRGWPR
jgi:CHAD domain-containing protein